MLSLQIDGQLSMSLPANPDTRDEWMVQTGDVTLCLFVLPHFFHAWFAGMEERLGSYSHRGWLELFFCSSSELWVKRKRITGVFIPTWKEGEQRERIKMLGVDGWDDVDDKWFLFRKTLRDREDVTSSFPKHSIQPSKSASWCKCNLKSDWLDMLYIALGSILFIHK